MLSCRGTMQRVGFFVMVLLVSSFAYAEQVLQKIEVNALPGERVGLTLEFSKKVFVEPKAFVTKKPKRIVFDFPKVMNHISREHQNQNVKLSMLRSYSVVQGQDRTRLILSLENSAKYTTRVSGKKVFITLSNQRMSNVAQEYQRFKPLSAQTQGAHKITGVDFHSGEGHSGRVVVNVSDADIAVDVKREGQTIHVTFLDASASKSVLRRYDVKDFNTPVDTFDFKGAGKTVNLTIKGKGDFEHYAYQINDQFIIEVKPYTAQRISQIRLAEPKYTGKRISLNFQNISIRAVLQILAEFTSINIVVSDNVKGQMTLRLNSVPWDQTLDIILKTRGLAKRKVGNVIIVAPVEEIAIQEKHELEAKIQVKELSPLRSELLQINYAKASEVAQLLKDKENSLLSPRGQVSIDARTNMLWVQDIGEKLEEVRQIVRDLDIPVRQVLIEARIVNVDKNFERDLGLSFGLTGKPHVSGTLEGANEMLKGIEPAFVNIGDRLNLDLPARPEAGDPVTFGLALARLGNVLLDLELSALESEGRGEVIASPRLVTANQQAAIIEAGEEIPYQEATSSGATAVAFKKAVLSLKVTPQITPDEKVILTLKVNQDEPTAQVFNGVPAIKTKSITSQVLVSNGETIVLGGIYKQTINHDVKRVPLLGTLPLLGYLFRNTSVQDKREELLIFITPKIIKQ